MTDTSAVQLVTVVPNQPPVISITPNNNLVHCSGAPPLVLVASGAATYVWSPDIAIPNGVGDSALAAPFANTFYNIVGTDSVGCTGDTTIQVFVANSPNVNGFTNNDTICEGQSVNLSAFVQGPGMGIQFQWNPGGLNGPNQNVSPTSSTTYVVTATNMQTGCAGNDTVLITVNPANVAAFTYSVNVVTVTFTNGSTGGTAWTWLFGDGNTSTDENPVYTYAGENTYTVTLIVSNGLCPNDTIVQQVVVGSVGIENVAETPGLVLFPNPATSLMTLQFESDDNFSEISILNALGQIETQIMVEKGAAKNYSVELDLQQLAAGLHLIKIQSESSFYITSFLKK
jgi:PKD repeat protein